MLTETFDQDLAELASTLGLPLEYRRERITSLAKAAVEESQIQTLRHRLSAEYELLEKLKTSGRLRHDQTA
jgi:hypothetical protein